jgi:L-aspartate oxidase
MPAGRIHAEIAVVGAGAAGLYAALTAARAGARVVLVSATPLARTASYWAQGGLAAALAPGDSPELHLEDTERAGRDLVRTSAAAVLCREAAGVIADLQRLGVGFDTGGDGELALGLEGGHSRRRVAHAGGSATGRRVVEDLSAVVLADPRIEVLEGSRAAVLWTTAGRCVGLVCQDGRAVAARAVVLATGGAAALWARTTNPAGSVGSGLLLARDAGADLADLELMQFHPTAITGLPGREGFLVTEAIRGEGARLLDAAGERFVDELAPRDEVARLIWAQMSLSGRGSVDLDMRDVDPGLFPNVATALLEAGVDPTRHLIPVAPAAHYGMGGVVSDLDGATTVPGLYAVGETACTGLHGANRLASNSLTECLVFGARGARAAVEEPLEDPGVPPPPRRLAAPSAASREALWRDAGLVRTREGLERLLSDPHPLVSLVAAHALARTESRGAHRRLDLPDPDPALDRRHSVSRPGAGRPVFERWN